MRGSIMTGNWGTASSNHDAQISGAKTRVPGGTASASRVVYAFGAYESRPSETVPELAVLAKVGRNQGRSTNPTPTSTAAIAVFTTRGSSRVDLPGKRSASRNGVANAHQMTPRMAVTPSRKNTTRPRARGQAISRRWRRAIAATTATEAKKTKPLAEVIFGGCHSSIVLRTCALLESSTTYCQTRRPNGFTVAATMLATVTRIVRADATR